MESLVRSTLILEATLGASNTRVGFIYNSHLAVGIKLSFVLQVHLESVMTPSVYASCSLLSNLSSFLVRHVAGFISWQKDDVIVGAQPFDSFSMAVIYKVPNLLSLPHCYLFNHVSLSVFYLLAVDQALQLVQLVTYVEHLLVHSIYPPLDYKTIRIIACEENSLSWIKANDSSSSSFLLLAHFLETWLSSLSSGFSNK
jgi:hypothetical protein